MSRDSRTMLIVLGVLVLIALILPMFGWGLFGGVMGWGMMGGPGAIVGQQGTLPFWVPLLGMLSMLAFWGALVVGVVLLIRWFSPSPGRPTDADSALDLLRRRYAAGEITRV